MLSQGFNPRAREERDLLTGDDATLDCVVSTHAPVKSATLASQQTIPMMASFNPRAREERDAQIKARQLADDIVSTHAPVKSATESLNCTRDW